MPVGPPEPIRLETPPVPPELTMTEIGLSVPGEGPPDAAPLTAPPMLDPPPEAANPVLPAVPNELTIVVAEIIGVGVGPPDA